MRAIISASYPILIQTFVSTEVTRYYLNGFYVHPDPVRGLRIVATDGHRMGVFRDCDGIWEGKPHEGMIIQLDKSALSLLKEGERSKRPRWLIVEGIVGDNKATIIDGDPLDNPTLIGTYPNVLIDGTFPDYKRVIPPMKGRRFMPQSYQMKYVADFAKILKGANGGRIRVISKSDTGPALVLTNRDDFFGILMPQGPGWEKSNSFPEFWTAKPPKVVAKKPGAPELAEDPEAPNKTPPGVPAEQPSEDDREAETARAAA